MPRISSLPIGARFRSCGRIGELLHLSETFGAQVSFLLQHPEFKQPVPGGRSWYQTHDRKPQWISLATEVEVFSEKEASHA